MSAQRHPETAAYQQSNMASTEPPIDNAWTDEDSGYLSSPPSSPFLNGEGGPPGAASGGTSCAGMSLPAMDTDEPLRTWRGTNPRNRRKSKYTHKPTKDKPRLPVADRATALFSGTFDHKTGGILSKTGSDVYLNVPPGAVPVGKIYKITGIVHTNLKEQSAGLGSGQFVLGPVPEYHVEGGGRFDIPVEIVIPHCQPEGTPVGLQVHYGHDHDLKQITNQEDDVKYEYRKNAIHIWTKHFTKFVCSAAPSGYQEITDALLTVAAAIKEFHNKSVISLRVMLHSRCSAQTDFTTERSQFYDPDMEEIRRLKVDLPERGELPYPRIVVILTIDRESGWKEKEINGQVTQPLKQEKEGEDILCPRSSDQNHRSEQLADFSLCATGDVHPVCCQLTVNFIYNDEIHKNHVMDLDFPIAGSAPSRKTSQADPLNEVFKSIARDLGDDSGQLGVRLGIEHAEIQEINRNNHKIFDRNYHLLSCWRKTATEPATIESLMQALRDCNRHDLVDKAFTASSGRRNSLTTNNTLTGAASRCLKVTAEAGFPEGEEEE